MAIRLDKAFGADMETLMRMQGSYDIAQARLRQGEIRVARYEAADCGPQLGISERKLNLPVHLCKLKMHRVKISVGRSDNRYEVLISITL